MVTQLLIGQTEEIKIRCFRVTTSEGFCDCFTPLDNLGELVLVVDHNGDIVPYDKDRWEYLEFCVKNILGLP
jgi:hypothetical protein